MTLDNNKQNCEELVSLLKALLDATPDLIFAKDRQFKYIAHNKAFAELVGRPHQDLTGLTDSDIFSSRESIERLRKTDIQVVDKGKTLTKQETTVYPNGKSIKVDTLKVPIHNELGEIMGLLGISRDVTKRVEAEQQLSIAKEKAEAANQAKSEFLAKMSHEIRTPMNAVIGLSQLLGRTQLNEEQLDYVDKIINSADVLLGLINDILDYSKIEANQLTLENIPFTLQTVLDKTITICELKAVEKNLEFIIDVPSSAPSCMLGDPNRLQQILINLTNNAIKFTESGHVIVKAEFINCDDNIADIKFSVSDTGIGMTLQEQQSLFNAFCQIDNSLTRQFEGSGLGLVICKQLVELMQGQITVVSKPGEGSTFSFNIRLPIIEASKCPKIEAINYPKTKILVVDDSAVARRIVIEILQDCGCQIESAESGSEAIKKVIEASQNRQDFDLIIMDWRMPELDGISAARQIKQDLGKAHIPAILLLSAYDLDEAKRAACDIPFNAYLEKPVIPATLIQTINSALTEHNQKLVEPTPPPAKCISKWDTNNIDFSQARILLVEDNNLNRKVICGFLASTNIQIDMAVDGAEAVRKVAKNDYDLVLMDIQMPIMDGYTATKHILADDKNKSLPIIAMTAHAMESDKILSLNAGMKAHITKPIAINELFETLLRWIKPSNLNDNSVNQKQFSKFSDHSLLVELDELPQLDIVSAAQPFKFNQKLFTNLVKDFCEENAAVGQLINDKNQDSLYTKVHSLKASLAYIGAYELSRQCAYTESLIKQNQNYHKDLAKLSQQTQQLVDSVQTIISQYQLKQAETDTNLPLKQKLETLLLFLEESDFAAEPILDELLETAAKEKYSEQLAEMARLVASVEFEKASRICQSTIAEIEND